MDGLMCPRCDSEGKIDGKVSIGWVTATCNKCGWSHSKLNDASLGMQDNLIECMDNWKHQQLGAGYREPKKK